METLLHARQRPIRARVDYLCADVEALPLATDSYDSVTSSLCFCSVRNPAAALAEVRRVLRPGGWLLMMEHVRGGNWLTRRLTDLLEGPWLSLSETCHLSRETAHTVAQAGFDILCTSWHVLGIIQIIVACNPRVQS
jgi:ubiquinone/menaquinone biosynthesis C-methylase UbiE